MKNVYKVLKTIILCDSKTIKVLEVILNRQTVVYYVLVKCYIEHLIRN